VSSLYISLEILSQFVRDVIEEESPAAVEDNPEAREIFLRSLDPDESYQKLIGLICPIDKVSHWNAIKLNGSDE
jgi:hypothetical protein